MLSSAHAQPCAPPPPLIPISNPAWKMQCTSHRGTPPVYRTVSTHFPSPAREIECTSHRGTLINVPYTIYPFSKPGSGNIIYNAP